MSYHHTMQRQQIQNNDIQEEPIDIALSQTDKQRIKDTNNFEKGESTKKAHRTKIKEMIEFIEEKYPNYSRECIHVLTPEQLTNREYEFFYNEKDFIYNKLDSNIIKAFMATKKIKKFKLPKTPAAQRRALEKNPEQKDMIMSYDHIRKYHDAILFGSKQVKQMMPNTYYMEMKMFLDNYKKEVAAGKKAGIVEEASADPFTFPLFNLLCSWFLESGYIFAWLFLILRWNCMARSISIDHIGFRNFKKANDAIVTKYDKTKGDKTGENCTNNHLHANPTNPTVCLFLALGIYCSLENVALSGRDFLFIQDNKKLGTAAANFNIALDKIISKYEAIVESYIRANRGNSHGIRKGSSTYATSGTTAAPSLISLALRREWSMGKVFDIYFVFGETGDNYLGRVLAGSDPNSTQFGELPPYFKEGMDNVHIKNVMNGMFGNIIKKHPSSVPILQLCMASIIFHSSFIKKVVQENPGHVLSNLYILNNEELLIDCEKLITQEKGNGMTATGIPPHVKQITYLKNIYAKIQGVTSALESQTQIIVEAVRAAIENNDLRSGALNLNTVQVKLAEHTKDMKEICNDVLDKRGYSNNNSNSEKTANITTNNSSHMYCYDRKFWDVPKNFIFPKKMFLKHSWIAWLIGFPEYSEKNDNGTIELKAIKPLRFITPGLLPKKLRLHFRNSIMPVMKMMAQAASITLNDDTEISADFINSSFEDGVSYVRREIQYIFKTNAWMNWQTSTFAKMMKYSSIIKYGTEDDKVRANATVGVHSSKRVRRNYTFLV